MQQGQLINQGVHGDIEIYYPFYQSVLFPYRLKFTDMKTILLLLLIGHCAISWHTVIANTDAGMFHIHFDMTWLCSCFFSFLEIGVLRQGRCQ